MKFQYRAYGLTIFSEIELPELPELCSRVAGGSRNDVCIFYSDSLSERISHGTQVSPFLWVSAESIRLIIPGIAEYIVESGRRIYVAPLGGAAPESVRVFLHTTVFAYLLYQRGFIVLSGNAVANDSACLLFLGATGAGKSSLSAAMMSLGYEPLSDELVAIDNMGKVYPGVQWLRLWPDAVDKLHLSPGLVRPMRPSVYKQYVFVDSAVAASTHTISAVFKLGQRSPDWRGPPAHKATGAGKVASLQVSNFSWSVASKMGLEEKHSSAIWELSRNIEMFQLLRPTEKDVWLDLKTTVAHIVDGLESG